MYTIIAIIMVLFLLMLPTGLVYITYVHLTDWRSIKHFHALVKSLNFTRNSKYKWVANGVNKDVQVEIERLHERTSISRTSYIFLEYALSCRNPRGLSLLVNWFLVSGYHNRLVIILPARMPASFSVNEKKPFVIDCGKSDLVREKLTPQMCVFVQQLSAEGIGEIAFHKNDMLLLTQEKILQKPVAIEEITRILDIGYELSNAS